MSLTRRGRPIDRQRSRFANNVGVVGARRPRLWRCVTAFGLGLLAASASAQVTPTAVTTPPDDNPSVRIGGTLFTDFSRTIVPPIRDDGGGAVSAGAFNVTRAYLNVVGQLNHRFAFRVTPDIVRETAPGSTVDGSMVLRLKYGYVQMNLDDWLWRGTFVRAGISQTPYVDFEETVYRYRFQGTVFAEREGFMISSDYGALVRTLVPRGYGEIVAGVYNGEGYARPDPNDQKAIEIRGTLRPFPSANLPRGLRVTVFHTADHAVKDADRLRTVGLVTFEHRFVNMAWSYLDAVDQASPGAARQHARGTSFWITPRVLIGPPPVAPPAGMVRASLEGLFRYDRLEPNRDTSAVKRRWIVGAAYWPGMRAASYNAAFLVDLEQVSYADFEPVRPDERRLALHVLVAF